jgi:hypothetical protein
MNLYTRITCYNKDIVGVIAATSVNNNQVFGFNSSMIEYYIYLSSDIDDMSDYDVLIADYKELMHTRLDNFACDIHVAVI